MVSTNTCDGSWLLTIYDLVTYYRAPTTQADPESDGPALPTSKDDEFRPFIRRRNRNSYLVITPRDDEFWPFIRKRQAHSYPVTTPLDSAPPLAPL